MMLQEKGVVNKALLFDWLLQRHVHEYFDVDGRPVGEGRSKAYAQVKTLVKSCPYAGSRHHHPHPMNVSALQSILPEWQTSLSLLAWLSDRYQQFYHKPVASYYDLALISGMGVFLTDYMALRCREPVASHQIPVWMSGLYKVCLGFQQATFLAMMNDSFKNDSAEKTLPDAKGFYAYLEEQALLIGPEEVCGGSEEMISRAYDTMKGLYTSSEIIDHLPSLMAMSINWTAYDVFSANVSNLWRKAILFAIYLQDFGVVLNEAALPAVPIDLIKAINTYLDNTYTKLLAAQSGLAVEIAHFTVEDSGHSLEEWLNTQTDFLHERSCPLSNHDTSYELVEAIMQQLESVVNLSCYHPLIAAAISAQLARYELLEAAVLKVFNNHLETISIALGYESVEQDLRPIDLSTIYGKTLRDWPGIMAQERLCKQG